MIVVYITLAVIVVGSFVAKETGVYAMDFEQFAVGTAAPANNASSIPNIYNASMTTVDIKNDETHGHYLDVVYENASADTMWPAFFQSSACYGHTHWWAAACCPP